MTVDAQASTPHYFNMYAVRDRLLPEQSGMSPIDPPNYVNVGQKSPEYIKVAFDSFLKT